MQKQVLQAIQFRKQKSEYSQDFPNLKWQMSHQTLHHREHIEIESRFR